MGVPSTEVAEDNHVLKGLLKQIRDAWHRSNAKVYQMTLPDTSIHTEASLATRESVTLYFQRLGGLGGGAERMLCALANALLARGYQVSIVTWDPQDAKSFYFLDSAVQWHRLGISRGVKDKLRRAMAMRNVLKLHGSRCLIGFVMSGDMTVYSAALLSRTPIVAAERNGPSMYRHYYSPARRRLNFCLLKLAHRLTVQLPGFVAGYPKRLRSQITVIPNPVWLPETVVDPGKAAPSGRFRLLFAGRLDPIQKRPLLLARAFSRIARDFTNWELVFVGDGPEKLSIEILAKEEGLLDRMIVRPTTSRIEREFLAAHLFVMPSLWEGFPNALAEAMAQGLPAIGYKDADGVSELISDTSGWLAADEGDPVQALSLVLCEAMGDASMRVRRGKAAREAMRAFEPETIFDRWSDMIDALSKKQGRS